MPLSSDGATEASNLPPLPAGEGRGEGRPTRLAKENDLGRRLLRTPHPSLSPQGRGFFLRFAFRATCVVRPRIPWTTRSTPAPTSAHGQSLHATSKRRSGRSMFRARRGQRRDRDEHEAGDERGRPPLPAGVAVDGRGQEQAAPEKGEERRPRRHPGLERVPQEKSRAQSEEHPRRHDRPPEAAQRRDREEHRPDQKQDRARPRSGAARGAPGRRRPAPSARSRDSGPGGP